MTKSSQSLGGYFYIRSAAINKRNTNFNDGKIVVILVVVYMWDFEDNFYAFEFGLQAFAKVKKRPSIKFVHP